MIKSRTVGSALTALSLSAAACHRDIVQPPPYEPLPGFFIVANATTGGTFDPDGFTVRIDGASPVALELNEAKVIEVSAGQHVVELGGAAPNCSVDTARRTVFVGQASTVNVWFEASCTPQTALASTRILHARLTADLRSSLIAVNADGSERVLLTSDGRDNGPALSPDDRRIVFSADRDGDRSYDPTLYLMNADGSDVTRLLNEVAHSPTWFPDGSRILYLSGLGDWGGMLASVRPDGSDAKPLLGEYHDVSGALFSPDGSRIGFIWATQLGMYKSVGTMNADGSGLELLTNPTPWLGFNVAWSPDGRRLAYSDSEYTGRTFQRSRILALDVETGVAETLFETEVGSLYLEEWSADGSTILFTRGRDIFLLRLSDRSVVRVTADTAHNMSPTFWRPR